MHGTRAGFLDDLRGALLAVGGLLLVVLIALLDYATEPQISFNAFYLIPVAVCAWWGGFSHGLLLSIGGAIAWQMVDSLENPLIPPTVAVWNSIVRFGTLALTSSLVSRLQTSVHRERLLARTDPLTGAANARTFYESAAVEAARASRAARPLTLAYLDLDNFKQLNDRLGHAAGDAALRHVVQTIQQQLRSSDLLTRLGGDEFALLLPETEAEGALRLLTRLQGQLAKEMTANGWPVTLSAGAITFLRAVGDVHRMIQRVDALMYVAKRKGKGRVEHEVLQNEQETRATIWQGVERRAVARILSDRPARVRPAGQTAIPEEFATVHDLSCGGIGLYLEKEFPPETVLIIESVSRDCKTLLARVVRVSPQGRGWLHGCLLSTRLGEEEIQDWLGQALLSTKVP